MSTVDYHASPSAAFHEHRPVETLRRYRALWYEFVLVKGVPASVVLRNHRRLTAQREDGLPASIEDLRRALDRYVSRRISDARRTA